MIFNVDDIIFNVYDIIFLFKLISKQFIFWASRLGLLNTLTASLQRVKIPPTSVPKI